MLCESLKKNLKIKLYISGIKVESKQYLWQTMQR